jgi:glutamyl aminopeptidase
MKLNKKQLRLFERLTQLNGVSGYENEVAKFLRDQYLIRGLPFVSDHLGSIFAYKKSKQANPFKVMIMGHMDEIGFLVSSIENNGMIKVLPVGGINPLSLTAQRVVMKGKKGHLLYGAIDATPPHLLKKTQLEVPKIEDLLFDFGFTDKQNAIDNGAFVGAMIVVLGSFKLLNNGQRILGKAFDNRYGLILGLEILDYFKNIDLPFDLYVGGTVQEEVGCRGAITSTHLIKPDLAIVLDCSPSRDSRGDKEELGQLAQGVLLRYIDASMIAYPPLLEYQEQCAKKAKAKYQYYSSPGGTDAGTTHINLQGILTLTHCIVARSIHTNSSILDVNDYQAAKKTLIKMIKGLNIERIEKWKKARI